MTENILVVDDDADNRRIIELSMLKAGYRVTLAVNGQDAIAAVERERPDLILLDLSMPVLSGWETIKLLKADERLKGVPVLAFTAHAMSDDERKVMEAGFDGYLTKPCTPRRAVEVVAAQLLARGAGSRS